MAIEQCVVLAGGQGTRLRPLTLDRPKPLVLCNGRPFITYLLDQLSAQGIKRFLILAGYKADAFDPLASEAVQIIKQPEDWETGKRIWQARKLLDERYLLIYSDTLCPDFDLARLCDWAALRSASSIIQTVTPDDVDRGYMYVWRDRLLSVVGRGVNPTLNEAISDMVIGVRSQYTPTAFVIDTPDQLRETEIALASYGDSPDPVAG